MTKERYEELKPCPFCGGKAAIYTKSMAGGFKFKEIGCPECLYKVIDYTWNTRSKETEYRDLLVDAREALEGVNTSLKLWENMGAIVSLKEQPPKIKEILTKLTTALDN